MIKTKPSSAMIRLWSQCVFLLCVIASATATYAQEKELLSLLELYPEEEATKFMSVYTVGSKTQIAEVSQKNRFQLVEKQGEWGIIRFDTATVPLWVSEDYVTLNNGVATITVNRLNARLRPTLTAPVIVQVAAGYVSPVLGQQNGFVHIKAPAKVKVAANYKELAEISKLQGVDLSNRESSNSWAVNTKNVEEDESARTQTNRTVVIENPQPETSIEATPSVNDARSEAVSVESAVSANTQHLIAPGDSISLLVFGEPDLSAENVRVPESGKVSLPLIGSIDVGGKTTQQVEDMVRGVLSQGYVNNPRLSVTIFSYRPIFIRGAVRTTGAFPYTEGLTIAKAIALAGGSKNSAKQQGISILRDGQTVQENLALDSTYQVASGDVITIDEEIGGSDDAKLYIYLHGEVASPGAYLYRRDLTVEKAIVLAGGFTLRGSKNKVKVTRYADVSETGEPIKLKGVKLYTPIKPGDVINVGARWF